MEAIQQLLKQTCEYARQHGAQECDILLRKGSALSMSAFNAKIDKYQVSSAQLAGIRVLKDNKIGIASSSLIKQEALEEMAKVALTNADFSTVSDFQKISREGGEVISVDDFVKDDTTIEDKISLAIELEKAVKDLDPSAKVPYTAYRDGINEVFYHSDSGKFCYEKNNYFTAYTSALLEQHNNSGTFFAATSGRKFTELDIPFCVDKSVEVARYLLEATACPTGKYDIIFSVDILGDLLEAFSALFSAKTAMEGKNRFGKLLHSSVAGKNFTLCDIPNYTKALTHSSFDSEGTRRKKVDIIHNGVLESLLHNWETANYYTVSSTGHASRAPQSSLDIAPTNLVVSPGKTTDIWSGTVIKIIKLDGIHSGKSIVSGDFSFGASGFLMRNGKIERALKGITLSGNFFSMLQQIEGIGMELFASEDKTFFAPDIRFANLDIAG